MTESQQLGTNSMASLITGKGAEDEVKQSTSEAHGPLFPKLK